MLTLLAKSSEGEPSDTDWALDRCNKLKATRLSCKALDHSSSRMRMKGEGKLAKSAGWQASNAAYSAQRVLHLSTRSKTIVLGKGGDNAIVDGLLDSLDNSLSKNVGTCIRKKSEEDEVDAAEDDSQPEPPLPSPLEPPQESSELE